MRRVYQISELLASGKEVFVEIDVHKDSFHVTAIADGEEIFNGGMSSRYEVLRIPVISAESRSRLSSGIHYVLPAFWSAHKPRQWIVTG